MKASTNGTKIAISSAQVRAGRALVGWSQDELVAASGVPKRTLVRFEQNEGSPQARTIDAIRSALEDAGIIFVDENGEGEGVRLRKRHMRGYVWDAATAEHLLSIRDGRVYRARDGQEVGSVVDGNILDLRGHFVCGLAVLESSEGAATEQVLPAALKALLV